MLQSVDTAIIWCMYLVCRVSYLHLMLSLSGHHESLSAAEALDWISAERFGGRDSKHKDQQHQQPDVFIFCPFPHLAFVTSSFSQKSCILDQSVVLPLHGHNYLMGSQCTGQRIIIKYHIQLKFIDS